ncbi:putative glucan 1,3-beta-glucosidase D [Vanrija pseudolonga]|uniref:glucan 1,3-beta-glucosidase n=1 Tax=Vanrija pseudolonga TaxID=143232 RepID=A0AAF1BKE7_9TREE|nr:putative glucan 1,3-beta-glucosidase D [Vanrija pseudolonga]
MAANNTNPPVLNPGVWHEDELERPSSVVSSGSFTGQPEYRDSNYLGAHGDGPAPSIISRDSTYGSLAAPSIAGSASGIRSSWGSSNALAAHEQGPAGFDPGHKPRVQSHLAQAYTSPFPEDEERVGHYAPAAAVPTTDKEQPVWAQGNQPQRKKKSRGWLWALVALALIALIALAVGLGVGLTRNKKNNADSSNGKDHGNGSQDPSHTGAGHGDATGTSSATPSASATPEPTSGGQGSVIRLADGTNMTYQNPFGGYWFFDPTDPFRNDARCNNWTPALNATWQWGVDIIHGVNLGGWLNTEPFIVPGLYERYPSGPAGTTVDEYTLTMNMGNNATRAMTEHYDTFITERDFAEIATYGLNWIRLPIAHWAISTWDNGQEPYVKGVSWNYVLKAIQWARKYGLRINLDLHTVPGSQNGWNHSGKIGLANWLNGPMGLANAQRSLDYMRSIAQFITQPEYLPVIQLYGFLNEPNGQVLSQQPIASFYLEAYTQIRKVTGIGAGKGPMLSMHDAFVGIDKWYGFLPGADRLALDQHPYLIFQDQPAGSTGQGDFAQLAPLPCNAWAAGTNNTSNQFGANTAGEWSAAINDCGQWLNGVGLGQRYDGTFAGYQGKGVGTCDYWNDHTQWTQATKDGLKQFVMSSMDSLQNYFFWTWKIGNSTSAVPQPNPMWHYRLGVMNGWIPTDPREAVGQCARVGFNGGSPFNGQFPSAANTGGQGAGAIPAAQTAQNPWPPAGFTNVPAASISNLFQYTPTAAPVTLAGATFTYTSDGAEKTTVGGSGWANAQDDSRQAFTAIAGCQYMGEYDAANSPIPNGACGAGKPQPTRRDDYRPRQAGPAVPTAAP